MKKDKDQPLLEIYDRIIEIDESYYGGKEKNKKACKKIPGSHGKSLKTRVPILGIMDRIEGVKAFRLIDTTAETIIPIILKHVPREGTLIITDDAAVYKQLDQFYRREVVCHSRKQYYRHKDIHINTLEGFWALSKKTIYGTHGCVSPKHIQGYLDEQCMRYNFDEKKSIEERFNEMLSIIMSAKNDPNFKKITRKEISKFDPTFHRYSGRGVDYPSERLYSTIKNQGKSYYINESGQKIKKPIKTYLEDYKKAIEKGEWIPPEERK